MAKVGDKHFAEGWQTEGKAVSQKLAETRNVSADREVAQASRMMEKIREKGAEQSAKAETVRESVPKNRVESGRDMPQAFEKARPEVQDKAARHNKAQNSEFIKNKQDAAGLRKLETKADVASKMSANPATSKAITQKAEVNRPNVGQQEVRPPVDGLTKNASNIAERQVARDKAARHLPKDRAPQGQDAKKDAPHAKALPDTPNPAQTAAAANAPAPAPVQQEQRAERRDSSERKSESGEKSDKKTKSGNASRGVSHTDGQGTSRNLNAMLGGFGNGAGGEMENSAGAEIAPASDSADAPRAGALPETDPSFKAFNEYDSERPGVEMLKAKAQLFQRQVVKQQRIEEIAKLDGELGQKIEDLFRNKPFSERLIGDLKHEVKLAYMLGSIYDKGGFRG